MRNFYKYSLLTVLLTTYLCADAQRNKNNTGYFVTLQNDTLSCVFESRNWKKQPYEIKISVNQRDTVVNPEKIKGFYLPSADIRYEAWLVSPALYELNMQFAIGNDYKPFFDSARLVFARILYKGRLSLYLYKDPVERNHFLIRVGDDLTEIYKHLYSNAGGFHNYDPIVDWYKQYILVLKSFMTDCTSLYSIIDAIELNQENLIRLLGLYDDCMKSTGE